MQVIIIAIVRLLTVGIIPRNQMSSQVTEQKSTQFNYLDLENDISSLNKF